LLEYHFSYREVDHFYLLKFTLLNTTVMRHYKTIIGNVNTVRVHISYLRKKLEDNHTNNLSKRFIV